MLRGPITIESATVVAGKPDDANAHYRLGLALNNQGKPDLAVAEYRAAIELKPGYETFWTYIGHFVHSPFYVYAYAFGDCLVNSLYAVYEKSHEGFAERYLAMLAAGGTKTHAELLAPFGLDARDPSFWQGGLSLIERMIGELESLT